MSAAAAAAAAPKTTSAAPTAPAAPAAAPAPAAANRILAIGPSYADPRNARYVDKIEESTAPPQYTDFALLAKYFGSPNQKTIIDYSVIPEGDKKAILTMLENRIASLRQTLNLLLQTSSISLKNASYMGKIQNLENLVKEIKTGAAMGSAAAPAAAAAAQSVATATELVNATFAASFRLLQRNDPSANSIPDSWNTFSQQFNNLTFESILQKAAEPLPTSRATIADSITYLSHAHLLATLQSMLGIPPTAIQTYKKQFVPIFRALKTDLLKISENQAIETALQSLPSVPNTSTILTTLNTLLTNPTAKQSLPALLASLASPPTTYNDFVYYASMMLITQYIEENK